MKTLAIEVPDELYEAFEQMAAKCGRSVEAVALESLAKHAPKRPAKLTAKRRRAGLARLMRQRGITDALTTDRHLEREGFGRLLKP